MLNYGVECMRCTGESRFILIVQGSRQFQALFYIKCAFGKNIERKPAYWILTYSDVGMVLDRKAALGYFHEPLLRCERAN